MSLRQTGIIVTLRLTSTEARALRTLAALEGDTVSETIREALYRQYGIGGFGPCSSVCARPAGNTLRA
jgi:hypothetical protein